MQPLLPAGTGPPPVTALQGPVAEASGAQLLRAAAAVPHEDRQRAVAGLRRQLQVMATAAGARPDWTTLTVTGPTETPGGEAEARFEWTASVVADGVTTLDAAPDAELDAELGAEGAMGSPLSVTTHPMPAIART